MSEKLRTILKGIAYILVYVVVWFVVYAIVANIAPTYKPLLWVLLFLIPALFLLGIVLGRRRHYRSILNEPEPAWTVPYLCEDKIFTSDEETDLNLAYRQFNHYGNRRAELGYHIRWLETRLDAAKKLHRSSAIASVEQELARANAELDSFRHTQDCDYKFTAEALLAQDPNLEAAFTAFTDFPCFDDHLPMEEFFERPGFRTAALGTGEYLIFCPAYVLQYFGRDKIIGLVPYADFRPAPDAGDKIACITIDGKEKHLHFDSVKQKESFLRARNAWLDLINREYQPAAEVILYQTDSAPWNVLQRILADAGSKYRERKETEEKQRAFLRQFKVENGVLTEFKGRASSLVIPANLATSVGREFCKDGQLQEVVIPEGVLSLGTGAFANQRNLKKVTLPGTLRTIGDSAFYHCSSLTSIHLPAGVEQVGTSAFDGCTSLERVTYSRGSIFQDKIWNTFSQTPWATGLIHNGFLVFERSLQNYFGRESAVTVPFGVKTVGEGAFAGNRDLREVRLPSDVTKIGREAFSGCTSLTDAYVPASVSKIDDTAFAGCEKLTLHCHRGSAASKYHQKSGIPCVYLLKNEYTVPEEQAKADRRAEAIRLREEAYAAVNNAARVSEGRTHGGKDGTGKATAPVPQEEDMREIREGLRRRRPDAQEPVPEAPKASPAEPKKTAEESGTNRGKEGANSSMGKLSAEEQAMILELRRKRHAEQAAVEAEEERARAEEEARLAAETAATKEYSVAEPEIGDRTIHLLGENRVISNNLFRLTFAQSSPVSPEETPQEYEVFLIDSGNDTISSTAVFSADGTDPADLTKSVTLSLDSGDGFDPAATYYLILRKKGAGRTALLKEPYQINVAFASDFDF